MRKPLTGEPCAGEPHARFGGRGGNTSRPLFFRLWSRLYLILISVMFIVLPSVVQASVVDSGTYYYFNKSGVNLTSDDAGYWPIAFDQTNNLYWLNLNATHRMTGNEVFASTLMTDWQSASLSQVESFFDSISPGLGSSPSTGVHNELVSLFDYWPGLLVASGSNFQGFMGNNPSNPTEIGRGGYGSSNTPWVGMNWAYNTQTVNDPWVDSGEALTVWSGFLGFWLVSSTNPGGPIPPTPLPPTAALFPVGIAFMEWRRRRKASPSDLV